MMTAAILAMGGNDAVLMALLVVGPLMAFYGVYQLVADLKAAPRKKIEQRLRGRGQPGMRTAKANAGDIRRHAPKAIGAMSNYLATFSATEKLQTILDQANINWNASQLLVNLTLGASIALALMLLLKVPLLVALGVVGAIYVLPIVYLTWKLKQRINKLVGQLPDVFELLGQALRAGHSLASGMQVVASELPDPAGTEFGRVFQEQNLGLKIEDALTNLANRMDVLDVRFFVTAVLIQRQTGGDLAEVLDKISGVIRDRIKLHMTVLALTAEGRLSGAVLLALPLVVFGAMLKINYEYATTLLTHPTGQMMATFAAVSMLMGWVMIKKIINIKV
ncbi:MAG: type II secretion system F family protein [Planctomycetes bacterium]|nr:type II secretion system F family protein [Planctomycetota bacterium]